MRAQWRGLTQEELELFFRKQYSVKTNQFKNEAFLKLCVQMKIDPHDLKPKTLKDFKGSRNTGGDAQTASDLVSQARYDHWKKRRNNTLAILKVRMDDYRSGDF